MKKSFKRVISVLFAVVALAALAIPAFAAEVTYEMPDMDSAFGDSLSGLWTNVLGIVELVLPAGLAIMGVSIAIGLGKKFIRMFSRG